MKNNTVRLLATLIIIAIAAALLSCDQDHDDRLYEQFIIDPDKPDIYMYYYSSNMNHDWIERPNVISKVGSEEGYFWFTVSDEGVTISKTGRMAEVRYYPLANSPGYVNLEIIDNVVVIENLTPNGVIRTYGSLD